MKCPTCRHPAAAKKENPAFPFCSERCRLIDLGNWLGETYRLPIEEEDDEPEVTPAEASSPSARRDTRTS